MPLPHIARWLAYRQIGASSGNLEIAEVTSRFSDVPAFTSLICTLGFDFVWKVCAPTHTSVQNNKIIFRIQSDTSTHFMLFKFRKITRNRALTRKDWSVIEGKAKDLLTPCEYKRR
jgi:ribosomal RNA-processing protein 8